MEVFPVDMGGLIGATIAISLIVPLVITVLVIGVIVWTVRRTMPPREDPAVQELKARLARGEIDTAEYEVRLRALRGLD
jgi:uncharacterized membrane protein